MKVLSHLQNIWQGRFYYGVKMGALFRPRSATRSEIQLTLYISLGLYTDESPGLKVDPVVVLVLSLGFIFSVVALHSTYCNSFSSLFSDPSRHD